MQMNGTLMSGDVEVARINNETVIPINDKLLPLYLKRTSNIEGWLEERAIDRHRSNSRLLKKALRLTTAEDKDVVLSVRAATITDTYWFREDGCTLTYDDIKFKSNMFDKLALYGDPDSFNNQPSKTPELTNTGSYEKCWRLDNNRWWLYKEGKDNELFSELFIYHLGKKLGFEMAHYELENGYIRSMDFTNQGQVNYESMYSIVADEEDYQTSFNALNELCPKAAVDYVKMIYLDTLCFNMDRHTRNYGVLRDTKTGDVLGLAPNFDNNIALISRGYPKNIDRVNDKLVELFTEFIQNCDKAREVYDTITLPTKADILDCINMTGYDVDGEYISRFILNGAERVHSMLEEHSMEHGMKLE